MRYGRTALGIVASLTLLLGACAAQPSSQDDGPSSKPTSTEGGSESTVGRTWDVWMKWRQDDAEVFLPVSYDPWTGEASAPESLFYENQLSEDLNDDPYRLSESREWVIVDASDTEVRVASFPLSNETRTIQLADIPVKSRTYRYGTVSFVDGAPSTVQIPLAQFGDDGLLQSVELWHVDLGDEKAKPELVASSPDPATSTYSVWNADFRGLPDGQSLSPGLWQYESETEGIQFRGLPPEATEANGAVHLADGSELQLEVVDGESSTTLRTWWRRSEADDWVAVGKPATIAGSVGGPRFLAFPTEVPPAEK